MNATEHKNIVDRATAFYMDWESACNLCEDEFGGSTFEWYVRDAMKSYGWTDEEIARRDEFVSIFHLGKALKDIARRGTFADTNPTRRGAVTEEGQRIDLWWNRYLISADQAVRLRAAGALRDAGVRE